jgi:hypothetical protein
MPRGRSGMTDMNKALTVEDAYRAMLHFLDAHYKRTDANEIAALLGGLAFNEDGGTMDPAAWSDWLAAVEKARAQGSS